MAGFVPYEKLPKKKRRQIDRERRGSWGVINPITRRAENPKAYDRKKEARRWKSDRGQGGGLSNICSGLSEGFS